MTTTNPPATLTGFYRVGDLDLNRIGYGAMQLAGPGVFGPPRDRAAAIEVLRTAVELGVNHIDTADAYGPYITVVHSKSCWFITGGLLRVRWVASSGARVLSGCRLILVISGAV